MKEWSLQYEACLESVHMYMYIYMYIYIVCLESLHMYGDVQNEVCARMKEHHHVYAFYAFYAWWIYFPRSGECH